MTAGPPSRALQQQDGDEAAAAVSPAIDAIPG
jgi:hypothetical protein